MAITAAIQRGGSVYVYNEKGNAYWQIPGKLIGFTGTTITVQRAGEYSYRVMDEKGKLILSTPIRK